MVKRTDVEPKRWPRGYLGTNHETIGSSFKSVLAALKDPEQVLSVDEVERLQAVDPAAWYPVGWLLSVVEKLHDALGFQGVVRLGRRRFELSHRNRVVYASARDVVYGIEEMYRHSNRGEAIGGWKVCIFESGCAELEKTTPHHCAMEQGILTAALSSAQCPSVVTQQRCFRAGADSCIFRITPTFQDKRWFGSSPPSS
jgi:hypothetical protein